MTDSRRTFIFLTIIGALAFCGWWGGAYADKKVNPLKTTSYTRPKPTRPIKPEIPSTNHNDTRRVFLEYADSLYTYDNPFDDRKFQILKGNVKFRQGGMLMFCDSAYYYPELNSMDAFSNVRMERGDTLFVYSDVVYYDGEQRYARLRNQGRTKVRLVNRDVTLTTDSLDYSLNDELGWFFEGGKIEDKQNILTSIYGQYSPSTKLAEFYRAVRLEGKGRGFTLVSDTLLYNTDTHIAGIVSPTVIMTESDTIHTSAGEYNTSTEHAVLTSRSHIAHRDTAGRVVTLEGDSIIYDKVSRISRAYKYRDPLRRGREMVITDTARKMILTGGFGIYNDSTREAMATEYPLLMEYSRPDTLFLRADTILSRTVFNKPQIPDSLVKTAADTALIETHIAHVFPRARFFRNDIQGVADTITFVEADSMLYMKRKPIVWSDERQVSGRLIDVHFNDSTADWARLPDTGMVAEAVDEEFYNQLFANDMTAYLQNNTLKRLEAEGNVQSIFLPMEKDSTYNKLVYVESSFMTIDMADGQMDRLKMWPETEGTVTPIFMVKRNQLHLPGFEWYEAIRPRRQWYGDRVKWDDELGELPDELIEYFERPEQASSSRKKSVQQGKAGNISVDRTKN